MGGGRGGVWVGWVWGERLCGAGDRVGGVATLGGVK